VEPPSSQRPHARQPAQARTTPAASRSFERATRDPVTALPGAVLFRDRLDRALRDAQRSGEAIALVLLEVREEDGTPSPPARLALLAEGLRTSIRRGDTLARLPGPHFGVVLVGLGRSADAVALAGRLVRQLEPGAIAEAAPKVRAGVAARRVGPGLPPVASSELLAEAAAALEESRRRPDGVAAIGPLPTAAGPPRLDAYLRRALPRHQIRVVYQPELCLRTRRIAAVEALVRWTHPVLGAVAPERFLPVAEQIGLLADLGRTARRQALGLRRRLRSLGLPTPRVALNASPAELARASFADELFALVREAGEARGRVEIEVTEERPLPSAAVGTLLRLREAGVRILVDDFGRGHAGLATLRRIPAHGIKLDRSLVRGLGADGRGRALGTALVAAARRLGLEVIAEGVETEAERQALRSLGVDRIQGYLVSPPLSEAALRRRLAAAAAGRPRSAPPGPA